MVLNVLHILSYLTPRINEAGAIIVTEPSLGPLAWCTAKAVCWHWVVMKESTAFIAGPSKENGQLVVKRPKLPSDFWQRVSKGKVKESVSGCLISSWTFFWLVGGEVTRWYFGSQHHQLGSKPPGVYVLCGQHVVNFFHLVEVLSICRTIKGYGSGFYL